MLFQRPRKFGIDAERRRKVKAEALQILQHALGVDKYGQGEQYRNRFVTTPKCSNGKVCEELVSIDLMVRRDDFEGLTGGMALYMVTPEGVKAMSEESPKPPKLTRGQKRYRDYLEADCGLSFGEWLKYFHGKKDQAS